jgi:hypothetical protein
MAVLEVKLDCIILRAQQLKYNKFIVFGIFQLLLLQTISHADVVDFCNCSASASFTSVIQSERPTKACGGLDTGVGNPINVMNGNKYERVDDLPELPEGRVLFSMIARRVIFIVFVFQ